MANGAIHGDNSVSIFNKILTWYNTKISDEEFLTIFTILSAIVAILFFIFFVLFRN